LSASAQTAMGEDPDGPDTGTPPVFVCGNAGALFRHGPPEWVRMQFSVQEHLLPVSSE